MQADRGIGLGYARRFFSTTMLTLLMSVTPVWAVDFDREVIFAIAAQPLASALIDFSRQAKIQVMSPDTGLGERQAAAVNGRYSVRDALGRLLAGTDLDYSSTGPNTIAVAAKSASASSSAVQPSAEHPIRFAQSEPARAGSSAEEPGTQNSAENPDSQEDEGDLEEIVVTGTHIRGTKKSASPVLSFDRDDIERTGYSTVDQLMESLPQNSGAGASQDTVGTDSAVGNDAFGNAVNLRSLGVGTTLVLLNGRRLAPGGNSGFFVDISMIPLSAIERVEVLTDGASAIYGSDAVGGVVNFILKKDYEGAETGLRYGRVTKGGLREVQVSQSFGANWERGGGMLAYEYNHRDALDARDRDFSAGNETPRTLLPEQGRHSLYASAHQDLSERWSMFADALYSKRDVENVLTYFSLRNEEQADSEELYGTVGTNFKSNGSWRGEFSTSYSQYRHDESFVRTPLPDGEPDPQRSNVDTDVWSFDASANGTLLRLPGGDLGLALGASHRRETLATLTRNELEISAISPPERHVNAAFGEFFVPLFGADNRIRGMEALELTVAARYEDYNDFGNAVTPKVGLRWEPVSGLSLRGTYGESFKAPGLQQLAGGRESLLALRPSLLGIDYPGDPVTLLRRQAALPQLHEEKSKSWTAGFDLQPGGGSFSLGVTYFNIEFEGRIDSPVSAGLEQFFGRPDIYGAFLISNPSAEFVAARLADSNDFVDLTGLTVDPDDIFPVDAVLLWADVAVTNLAATKESGVDMVVNHAIDTAWGRLDTSLNATYLTKFENKVAPLAPTFDALNLLEQPIDLRLRGGLAWSLSNISASLFVNYQDDYKSTDAAATPIASWMTFDTQVRYAFDTLASGGPFDGVTGVLSVQNLFDKDPPFVADRANPIPHFGFDSVNATPLGRFIAAQITKSW